MWSLDLFAGVRVTLYGAYRFGIDALQFGSVRPLMRMCVYTVYTYVSIKGRSR